MSGGLKVTVPRKKSQLPPFLLIFYFLTCFVLYTTKRRPNRLESRTLLECIVGLHVIYVCMVDTDEETGHKVDNIE